MGKQYDLLSWGEGRGDNKKYCIILYNISLYNVHYNDQSLKGTLVLQPRAGVTTYIIRWIHILHVNKPFLKIRFKLSSKEGRCARGLKISARINQSLMDCRGSCLYKVALIPCEVKTENVTGGNLSISVHMGIRNR